MKKFVIALALLNVYATASLLHADETVGEKAAVVGNEAKRVSKKTVHMIEEGLCGKLTGDSELECMAKKAKNRAIEAKDAAVDKASQVKNAVD